MSTNKFTPFLLWAYNPETVQRRTRIIEDLVHYVLTGAENQYGRPYDHPQAKVFENDVKARMLEAYQPLMKLPAKSKAFKLNEGDDVALLIAAFTEASRRSTYGRQKFACPPFKSDALCKSFCAALNVEVLDTWNSPRPTVEGAMEMALKNYLQAETRLLTVYAIHDLLRMQEFRNYSDLQGTSEILHTLQLRRYSFLMHYATFAGLLGGEHVTKATKLLAEECCHKPDPSDVQYSLIQYMMADEKAPGCWSGADEQSLRDDIAAKYNALGG
jgi:hypothetical protein